MKISKIPVLLPYLLCISVAVTAQTEDGETLFNSQCAACHVSPASDDIPALDALSLYEPDAILMAMTDGVMRLQSRGLSEAERVMVAEFITRRQVNDRTISFDRGMCSDRTDLTEPVNSAQWNGWGATPHNRRFQDSGNALTISDITNLKLKWVFGIPNVTQSRSQPAIYGGRLFIGSASAMVYALDAGSGCTYWSFKAGAGVRTAISAGKFVSSNKSGHAVYFADAQTRVYAVDADTGKLIWSRRVDDHPAARATGSPTLYNGVLYVPVSGVSEESIASRPDYECCTFRGSITALNARTGEVVWKTYTVDKPGPRGKNPSGTQLYGPAGVAIWSAPTIDEKRGLLYTATGNAYADPAPETSDAIIALSLETGKIVWINQIMPDSWLMGCDTQSSGGNPDAGDNPNCPDDVGPDFDFSASPVLTTLPDGKDILIATQKSGIGYALDPDNRGKVIWEYRWGMGSPIGGVWGASVNNHSAFFAVADIVSPTPGGLHAVDLSTGKRKWYTPPEEKMCSGGQGCSAVQAAAVTSIKGAVFSGSHDGGLRVYSAETGEIIWRFNTNIEFETINGVKARGGSIDGPGPVVAGRMLYVTSGNGGFFGLPGNVLLAFEAE